ncbi:hypothetical protein RUM43_000565 [Polyplax serrata]|uniref:Uncharacterized protein n=1 Tax=Polyplax serrata TaxID=468196 RepID=A0AAN8SCM1_POLSC
MQGLFSDVWKGQDSNTLVLSWNVILPLRPSDRKVSLLSIDNRLPSSRSYFCRRNPVLSANVSHFNYATEFDLFISKVVKSVERRGSYEVNPSDRKRHTMDQLLIQVNHKRNEGSSAYKLSNVMVTTQERLFECFQLGKGPVAAAVSAGVRVFPEF